MSLLLSVQSVSKYFASEPIIDRVSFDVRAGQHVALIGPNGTGKTTLLKILTGDLEPDRGELQFANSASIGILRQRPDFEPGQTVLQAAESAMQPVKDLLLRADETAKRIAEASAADQRESLGRQYDRLQAEIEHRDGYQIQGKIEKILKGLGFASTSYNQPVAQLSGGQVNRLMLAKLLLEEPDLMLLDEPSNHLDIEATEWLEDFLAASRQAFILVSHDRYFLDRVVNRILELVHGTIDAYPGNYSKYLQLKADRLDVERRTFEKQQAEIAKMEDFIRRNHHGQKHAQAEDRRKKLERIELVAPPREIVSPPMRFAPASRTGDIVLRVEGLAKSYDNAELFSDLTLQIERGERWGILGPNGCGKTTFLKCLLGIEPANRGTVKLGTGVQIGFFDQQLKSVDDDAIAAEAIRPSHKEMIDVERRDLLALFGVTGDLALQPVRKMSGGERNRVALAFLAAQDANFLVLDEPTNHLDLWARESLERAIQSFEGTVLLVSHDRYFINQVCDHLIVFRPDSIDVFDGNYDTYRYIRQQKYAPAKSPSGPSKSKPTADRKTTAAIPAKRRRKYKYRKVDEIEADILQTEMEIANIHADLADPQVLRNGEQVIALQDKLSEVTDHLQQLYDHWEEAMELN